MQHFPWYSPALYGLSAIIILQYSGADNWLATLLFQLNQGWVWQDTWLLDKVLHKGGRAIVALWFSGVLLTTMVAYGFKLFSKTQRLVLLYTVLASTLSILLISGLKHITMLPCPWDVKGLGGDLPYRYLHQLFSGRGAGLQCFPAGHASGGYALFSLYFAAQIWYSANHQSKRVSPYWLLPALVVGGLFGLAQQLRGAHFLSHDITTALLCWLSCYGLWLGFAKNLNPQVKPQYLTASSSISKTPLSKSTALNLLEKAR